MALTSPSFERRRHAAQQVLSSTSWNGSGEGSAYAAANIALCKYWGKRDRDLHLPTTSSLSLSLPLGTTTSVSFAERDAVIFQGKELPADDAFALRITRFLDLIRPQANFGFTVTTNNTIPTAAGLASSASGFAALVLALNKASGWHLPARELSILARLGSGSASRSIFDGFVLWYRGKREDGSDSYAEPLDLSWPELRLGMLVVEHGEKSISSGAAMERTMATSPLYPAWVDGSTGQLQQIHAALQRQDIDALGRAAEANALGMHATMLAATPAISYWTPETMAILQKVWHLRKEGLSLYATLDAGPNVKLIFHARDEEAVSAHFPSLSLPSR